VCVETAAGWKPQTQFPDGPVGPKKNCSTLGFGRRALKISSICRPAPSKRDENDKFAGRILPPSVVHQCFRHPRLMSSVVDVKIPVQTSRGDKQGGPENLRRKFASNGSSPRHLCIEQALNLADRYRRVGGLSTCGCIPTVFAGIGHPWLPPPTSWSLLLCSSASSLQYRRATLGRPVGGIQGHHCSGSSQPRSVIAVQGFRAWGIESR